MSIATILGSAARAIAGVLWPAGFAKTPAAEGREREVIEPALNTTLSVRAALATIAPCASPPDESIGDLREGARALSLTRG